MNTEPSHIRLPLSRLSQNTLYHDFAPPLSDSEYQDLKASIRSIGTNLVPIIVEFVQLKDAYDIIDGYNRHRCLQELQILEADCIQVFTEEQRREALLANATRRQLTAEQRKHILNKGRAAFAQAHKNLIPALAALYKSGELVRRIGHENLLFLLNASREKQEEVYAHYQLMFSAVPGTSKTEALLQEQVRRLESDLLIAKSRHQQLEGNLNDSIQAKNALEDELEGLEEKLREAKATKDDEQSKTRAERKVDSLTAQITTLTTKCQEHASRSRILEDQLKTAQAEMKAAQISAKDMEKKIQTTHQRNSNPQIIVANFESIHRLLEAIQSQTIAAKPLSADEQAMLQRQITITRDKLDAVDQTLSTPGADIIPFTRHTKPRQPVTTSGKA